MNCAVTLAKLGSAGKQPKLTAWLGAFTSGPSSKPPAPAWAEPSSQTAPAIPSPPGLDHAATDTACSTASRANSLGLAPAAGGDSAATAARQQPSSITRKGSGARAGWGKHGARAGQTSLRAFMQRPPAATLNPASATVPGDSTSTNAGLLDGFAPASVSDPQHQEATVRQSDVGLASSSEAQVLCQLLARGDSEQSSFGSASQMRAPEEQAGPDLQLASERGLKRKGPLTEGCDMQQRAAAMRGAGSAVLFESHQQAAVEAGAKFDAFNSSQSNVPGSQASANAASDAGKAAVTAAWSKIQSKMKAPKCRGHSEDCVIREVKKNGPNKGTAER